MTLKPMLVSRATDEGLPLRVLVKEALQIYALSEIYKEPESRQITFQGGTCLRLVYGGMRYSEDIDFVSPLPARELELLFQRVSRDLVSVGPLFEGEITMRIQKESANLVRWRVYYQAKAGRDSTSFSVEFAAYPAYTVHIGPLHTPPGLAALPMVLVRAETMEEIAADKVAAIAGRRYVKGRDTFDLWMLKERGIRPDRALVEKKLADYSVPRHSLQQNMSLITPEAVRREMEHFLPRRYRLQLQGQALESLVTDVKETIRSVL
jgi:predicted nucleotidyltransferase component of viral defense system